MSNDTIINFNNVSKRYKIGYQGFRHVVQNIGRRINPLVKRQTSNNENLNFIWALKNVSFEVKKGEALGIIGHNGTGKTTILKILSGITSPTSGTVETKGRIGTLIQVGAGFHPELTGRENIYLDGSILGLKKKEIDKKFDEIVKFSELKKFIDTPVKKYSSGMYVRLGFSIAVHITPDILLIDEVLSVGDINFQNKSINRMLSFKNKDTAIVFVSHNLSSVSTLCDKVICLKEGKIKEYGKPDDVISSYLADFDKQREILNKNEVKFEEQTISNFNIKKVILLNSQDKETKDFRYKDDVIVRVYYEAKNKIAPYFTIYLQGRFGPLFAASMLFDGNRQTLEGEGFFDCVFKSVPLLPGNYQVNLSAREEKGISHIIIPENVATFNIISSIEEYGFKGAFALVESRNTIPIVHPHEWKFYD